MAILEELKAKANGAADQANNIQEAISMMEFGGGGTGSPLIVNLDVDEPTLDKTWQEIYDAFPNVFVKYAYTESRSGEDTYDVEICTAIIGVTSSNDPLEPVYCVYIASTDIESAPNRYATDSTDGYPQLAMEPEPEPEPEPGSGPE